LRIWGVIAEKYWLTDGGLGWFLGFGDWVCFAYKGRGFFGGVADDWWIIAGWVGGGGIAT